MERIQRYFHQYLNSKMNFYRIRISNNESGIDVIREKVQNYVIFAEFFFKRIFSRDNDYHCWNFLSPSRHLDFIDIRYAVVVNATSKLNNKLLFTSYGIRSLFIKLMISKNPTYIEEHLPVNSLVLLLSVWLSHRCAKCLWPLL